MPPQRHVMPLDTHMCWRKSTLLLCILSTHDLTTKLYAYYVHILSLNIRMVHFLRVNNLGCLVVSARKEYAYAYYVRIRICSMHTQQIHMSYVFEFADIRIVVSDRNFLLYGKPRMCVFTILQFVQLQYCGLQLAVS